MAAPRAPHTPPSTVSLPPWLAERTHALAEPRHGEFVIYWMRVALRGHENPALDTSLEAARALGVPVFVYQGLSERYPYASDRHHTFILQGTRDVQAELEARDVGYLLHVERPGARESVLRDLAARAALVVTEDLPVPPLDGWAHAVSRAAPLWLVDTACVVPLRSVRTVCDRAFRFRQEIEGDLERRLTQAWPEAKGGSGFVPRLDDRPSLDPRALDIAALVASCAIDHSVAPVPHTIGGSTAGYARWHAFRREKLARYAYDRNDPLRDPSSRMSAYLHYGMVSPLRIAREAAGFDKYIDELIIWRELAHHFCLHRSAQGPLESLDSLPRWAVETLTRHAADPRPRACTWETLSRGVTSDGLWNATQACLRIHGELHNNVRMTWGKTLLELTASPQRALEMLIDLNHRYALDGRDPSSYGGLLWCLGLFDRPFSPEEKITGTVRSRSSREHAARLDVKRYSEQVTRPALISPHASIVGNAPLRIAVIGAGVSGLACTRTLHDHGHRPRLFDKARRPGGRLASRSEGFDHGAPAFTAAHPAFRRLVDAWVEDGLAAPWRPHCARLVDGTAEPLPRSGEWFVGLPHNNRVAAHLAADLDVRVETRVSRIARDDDGWTLQAADASFGSFDAVVLAMPFEQTRDLLVASGLEAPSTVPPMQACVTAMVSGSLPIPLNTDILVFDDSPAACVIREGSKPGRPSGERFTVHFRPAWATAHLDLESEALQRAVIDALAAIPLLRDAMRDPSAQVKVHRWRYACAAHLRDGVPGLCDFDATPSAPDATPDAARGEPGCLSLAADLLLCGDAVGRGGAEQAWLSGVAAAARILASVAHRSDAASRRG